MKEDFFNYSTFFYLKLNREKDTVTMLRQPKTFLNIWLILCIVSYTMMVEWRHMDINTIKQTFCKKRVFTKHVYTFSNTYKFVENRNSFFFSITVLFFFIENRIKKKTLPQCTFFMKYFPIIWKAFKWNKTLCTMLKFQKK